MKRKVIPITIVCVLAVVLAFQIVPYVFAHPSSQEGILAKSYHEQYEGYYVGGENVGWSIDEGYHTNGTTLTYSFDNTDPYLTNTYKSYVTEGASRWSGTMTIINKTDGSGTGLISTFPDINTNVVAKFCEYSSDSSGHLTSWKIMMNRYHNVTATTLAHEFGHAIGLNDLYNEQNYDKLMCGRADYRTVTSPTASDIWGAKVITGVHITHTWAYKYHSTTGTGINRHIGYCTSCNGLSATISDCVYNSRGICIYCNILQNIQPW